MENSNILFVFFSTEKRLEILFLGDNLNETVRIIFSDNKNSALYMLPAFVFSCSQQL